MLKQQTDRISATCRDCKYFIQHYRRCADGSFTHVYCGHCYNIVKSRKPDASSCSMFEEGEFTDNSRQKTPI